MPVPPEVVEGLGAGRKPPVRVTVGGHTYRSTIASRGGVYLLPLSAENRTAAGVAAGDQVDVDVEGITLRAGDWIIEPFDRAADPGATKH